MDAELGGKKEEVGGWRLEDRGKFGNEPCTGFNGWMLRKKTGWGNKNE
jgi:hypothetical protein